MMTVQRLADAAGVSVRTLHVYDRMGLLRPSERTESGYRLYGYEEQLRLQQILFYRELDVPLKEIKRILDAPGFELIEALRAHACALSAKRDRLGTLIDTIDRTLYQLQSEETTLMKEPRNLYEGFSPKQAKATRDEAIAKYGAEEVARSEKALRAMSKEDFEALRSEQLQIRTELYALYKERELAADHPQVQAMIGRHYANVRSFWGTSTSADPQAEQYAGLGQLYVDDPRFMTFNGSEHPEYALFLRNAMKLYAETVLGTALN